MIFLKVYYKPKLTRKGTKKNANMQGKNNRKIFSICFACVLLAKKELLHGF